MRKLLIISVLIWQMNNTYAELECGIKRTDSLAEESRVKVQKFECMRNKKK